MNIQRGVTLKLKSFNITTMDGSLISTELKVLANKNIYGEYRSESTFTFSAILRASDAFFSGNLGRFL